MKKLQSFYVCGFNGFRQLCAFDSDPRKLWLNDKETESGNIFVTSPKLVSKHIVHENIKDCIFTWSQVWILLVNGAMKCGGFNNEKIARVGSTKAIIRYHDKDIIVQSTDGIVINRSDGTSDAVKLEYSGSQLDDMKNAGIQLVDSNKDYVYGIQDNQLLRGTVSKMAGVCTLMLAPLAVGIPVASVSCGFDHTLILSDNGTVFSFGSTSRGQLGHGEISVDIICAPKKIEMLSGMKVVAVASGGWHCAVVTDSGDLYVWGWNESGQLGLPNWSTEFEPWDAKNHTCCSDINFEADRGVVQLAECCGTDNTVYTDNFKHISVKRKYSNTEGSAECTTILCASDCASTLSLGFNKHGDNIGQHKHQHLDETSAGNVRRPLKLYQDLGTIQMQAVPFGLAIPDGVNAKAVACGSRHTCFVTEDGLLMTSGWNTYGQLCHGDTTNRDYFETVTEFMNGGMRVVSVKAGHWNTLIAVEDE